MSDALPMHSRQPTVSLDNACGLSSPHGERLTDGHSHALTLHSTRKLRTRAAAAPASRVLAGAAASVPPPISTSGASAAGSGSPAGKQHEARCRCPA